MYVTSQRPENNLILSIIKSIHLTSVFFHNNSGCFSKKYYKHFLKVLKNISHLWMKVLDPDMAWLGKIFTWWTQYKAKIHTTMYNVFK